MMLQHFLFTRGVTFPIWVAELLRTFILTNNGKDFTGENMGGGVKFLKPTHYHYVKKYICDSGMITTLETCQ